jgi:asparagine synthase (glutamine-hydrolysing)
MCGILGIQGAAGVFDSTETFRRLRAGVESLRHRGPDAGEVKVWPDDAVGFAHCRLAILDLDVRSNQPMVSADGQLMITFNGEIYNFRELRDELKRGGASFRTESDTEVLLEGYRRWGLEELLPRLRGMFAFALYDRGRRRLILARDRAGKKPLYYTDAGGLAFASELRGLLCLSPRSRELDPRGLDAYLALKFVPAPDTLLRGVKKVPPGFFLIKDGDSPAVLRRWWQPYWNAVKRPASPSEALDRVENAFEQAVRRRLVSDVPVCLFLSGGVDSSLIAAYLDKAGVRGTSAYTVGYEDVPSCNEFEFSRVVAGRFPLRYNEVLLSSRQALETLEDDAASLDEPVSDWVWVPLYHLSRAAHRDGFKVALVGEGSDELFVGYDVMQKGVRDLERFRRPLWRGAARVGASLLSPVYRVARSGHRRYDLMRRAATGEPVYLGSSMGFGKSQRHQIAGPALLAAGQSDAGTEHIRALEEMYAQSSPDPDDPINLISLIEFYTKMGEVLLQRVDRVTMLQSLEARSPFLDHDLVELAFAIPGAWKISGGVSKALLKELGRRTLPEEILTRKKMGFSFPFKEWLRGELGPVVEKTFADSRLISEGWINGEFCRNLLREHRSGRRDHAPRIWMLFDLCRWYDRWIAR